MFPRLIVRHVNVMDADGQLRKQHLSLCSLEYTWNGRMLLFKLFDV